MKTLVKMAYYIHLIGGVAGILFSIWLFIVHERPLSLFALFLSAGIIQQIYKHKTT
jgi:hypothetical protein